MLPLAGMVRRHIAECAHAQPGYNCSPEFAGFAVLAGLSLGLAEFIRTGGERSRLLAHLASYLPQPVARRLLTHAPQDGISAGRRDVTVLFADIRNFSAWCEAYDA
jgi:adenylate cyclase